MGDSQPSPGSDLSPSHSDLSTPPNMFRVPILYVILGVLLIISIVPMYFYSAQATLLRRSIDLLHEEDYHRSRERW